MEADKALGFVPLGGASRSPRRWGAIQALCPLSRGANVQLWCHFCICGAPGSTRTCNSLLRSYLALSAVPQIREGRAKRVQLSSQKTGSLKVASCMRFSTRPSCSGGHEPACANRTAGATSGCRMGSTPLFGSLKTGISNNAPVRGCRCSTRPGTWTGRGNDNEGGERSSRCRSSRRD